MIEPIPEEVVQHVTHPIIKLLQSRMGLWVISFISFTEAALPVPYITDPFMVAYILVNRNRTFWAIIVTTLTSVAGGIAAFYTAYFFSDLVMGHLSPSSLEHFSVLAEEARAEMFTLTILGAITPIPYTLVGLAGGFVKGSVLIFIIASIIGRGLRYAIAGYLTYKFGAHAVIHIKRHLTWVTIVTLIVVAGYVLSKFF